MEEVLEIKLHLKNLTSYVKQSEIVKLRKSNFDGTPYEAKVSRTVWVKGKSEDYLKGLPIDITIVMEDLKNIRQTAKSHKRADRNLDRWTFYQLQQFIEYKAKLSGINVIYIKAKYTSQRCSKCGKIIKKNRKRNLYTCNCGNHIHSDLNAARNIADKYLKKWTVRQQST